MVQTHHVCTTKAFKITISCFRILLILVFEISRYGRHFHTLKLEPPRIVKNAIQLVEEYLNEPMTQEYFDTIKDDLFPGRTFRSFTVRGDALGDCRFLETIDSEITEGGRRMKLVCGS